MNTVRFLLQCIYFNAVLQCLCCRWREWWTGRQELVLPAWDDLDETSQRTCEQFVRYHLQQCQEIIVSDRRYVNFTFFLFLHYIHLKS